MSDIRQSLGFDVSDALAALKNLDNAFSGFTTNLKSVAAGLSGFNDSAQKTIAELNAIAAAAKGASDAMSKVGGARTGGSKSGPTAGGPQGSTSDLLKGQQAAQAMNALLGQTTQAAGAATSAVGAVGNAANNAGNGLGAGARGAGGFAISLETLTRVITTQAIVRGLSAITSAVQSSIGDFIKFSTAVSQIQTISPVQDIDALASGVRELSDEFNSPILDVAKAKYQALSNGFITDADSTQILVSSLKLAKVGVSSTAEAVDLLSTGLNAYGQSAAQADDLAGKFFKTIELGRVTASDLSGAFGRVAPIANEIGASTDEILAAFSSITIGGVKAAEAATQIRASLSTLLKPSSDLEETFHKLGTNGELLIAAHGFQGAFEVLRNSTDGSLASLAKLVPNIRAINGVLRETGSGADVFREHLDQIRNSSKAVLDQKYDVFIKSNAQQVDQDFTKLKNLFTADFGKDLVASINTVVQAVGGIENVIDAMKALAPVVLAATAALVAFAAKAVFVRTAFGDIGNLSQSTAGKLKTFNSGFNTFLAGLGAGVTAFAFGDFIKTQLDEAIVASRAAGEEAEAAEQKFRNGQRAALAQLDIADSEQTFRTIYQELEDIGKEFNKLKDDGQEADKSLVDQIKEATHGIIEAREEYAKQIQKGADTAGSDVRASRSRNVSNAGALADVQFNFSQRNLDARTQSFRDAQRAADLANDAASKFAKAKTPDQQSAATDEFSRAEAYAKEALSTAVTSKNVAAIAIAEQAVESVLEKRIAAEKQFQQARSQDQKQLDSAAKAERDRLNTLKQLAKIALDHASSFDKKGNPFSPDEIKKRTATASEALEKFNDLSSGSASKGNFTIDDLKGEDFLNKTIQEKLTGTQLKVLSVAPAAITSLGEALQKGVDSLQIRLKDVALDPGALKGSFTDQLLDAFKQRQKQEQDQRTGAQNGTQIGNNNDTISGLQGDISKRTDNFGSGILAGFRRATGGAIDHAVGNLRPGDAKQDNTPLLLKSFAQRFNSIAQNIGPNSADQYNKIIDELKNVTPGLGNAFSQDKAALEEIAAKLREIIELNTQNNQLKGEKVAATPASPEDVAKRAQQGQDLGYAPTAATQASFAESAAKAAAIRAANGQSSAPNAQQLQTQTEVNQLLTSGAQAQREIGGAAEATVAVKQQELEIQQRILSTTEATAAAAQKSGGGGKAASPDEITEAFGGYIKGFASGGLIKDMKYFAGGGGPRGTDTILAWLSPGEFVMNAASTKKFYSQLTAMNSGHAPVYRAEGGTTNSTNISIGDINLNGPSPNGAGTARSIMTGIRRELRRNASLLTPYG